MVGQSSNSNAQGSESKKYWSRNTGKYLFYALGEIALVVIGILIALQINNWTFSIPPMFSPRLKPQLTPITKLSSQLSDMNISTTGPAIESLAATGFSFA